MVLAVLFSFAVTCAGFATLRVLGLAKSAAGFGLAPPAGLTVMAIVSSWSMLLGAPPLVAAVALFAIVLAGLGLAYRDRRSILTAARTLMGEQRLSLAGLLVSLSVPIVAMGFAFAGVQVPLSPHDGAFHVEAIHAYRLGERWTGWYPPGLAALFAAWLQAFPWLDSAQGTFELGLSLPTLAALSVYGLGISIWHDLRMASAGSLLLSLTYLYPYFPELWGGWPLAMSLVLVMGVWTVGLEYLNRPSARWGVLAGLMLGAIVLVHGSELYALALVLPLVLVGGLRRVQWRGLGRDVVFASGLALVCAAPYLPTLLHWAGSGGAYGVGLQDEQILQSSAAAAGGSSAGASGTLVVFALDSLGVDLPIRLMAVAIGVVWALRAGIGRSVVVVGALFGLLAAIFNLPNGVPAIHQLYALTFPWAMAYRLLMLVAIAQALLAGAGCVVALGWLAHRAKRPTAWARRLGRTTRLVVVTWVFLTTWAAALFLAVPAQVVLGYSTDDAAAMAWLRQHAAPGDVVANDGYADGGIWAPYKAGLPILLPRSASAEDLARAGLVIDNVARLDTVPEAALVVCEMNVRYVYRGARASAWDRRRFPALDELRRSPALEEVFSSGGAVVFRTRMNCFERPTITRPKSVASLRAARPESRRLPRSIS